MERTQAPFQLRLERWIKESLMEVAQKNFRSLNAEINARLAASLGAEKGKAPNA